jgi:hypothetical protein
MVAGGTAVAAVLGVVLLIFLAWAPGFLATLTGIAAVLVAILLLLRASRGVGRWRAR